MARIHRVTHPRLGPVTWKEMEAAVKQIRAELGRKVCTWCHRDVPAGARTRCGNSHCNEMICRAQSWQRCVRIVMARDRHRCKLCGRGAGEVDHIVPVSLGGLGDVENLRALCTACHKTVTKRLRQQKEKYAA